MMRRFVTIVIILLVLIGGGFAIYTFAHRSDSTTTSQKSAAVTRDTMTTFLMNTDKSLMSSKGQPVFKITDMTEPQKGWYIVSIVAKDMPSPTGKFIVNAMGDISSAYIVIGPESVYSSAELANYQIPEAVKKGILES